MMGTVVYSNNSAEIAGAVVEIFVGRAGLKVGNACEAHGDFY